MVSMAEISAVPKREYVISETMTIFVFLKAIISKVFVLVAYPIDLNSAIDFLRKFYMLVECGKKHFRHKRILGDDIEFYSRIFSSCVLLVGGLCPPLKTRDTTTANTRVARGLAAFKNAFAPATIAA